MLATLRGRACRDRTNRWALAWLGLIGLSALGSNSDAASDQVRRGYPSPATVHRVHDELDLPVVEKPLDALLSRVTDLSRLGVMDRGLPGPDMGRGA